MNGWADAERMHDEDADDLRAVIIEACEGVSILDLSESLGIQVHAHGLTCPNPDHYQSGASAPAWVWQSDDGIEKWKCGSCNVWGDAVTFVQLAEGLDLFEAIDRLRALDLGTERHEHRRIPRYQPEDPERCRTIHPRLHHDDHVACQQWCAARGWYPGLDSLLSGQVSFVYDYRGNWLRLFASRHSRHWWSDRALSDQLTESGEPWRWKSPAGRPLDVFWWTPEYEVTQRAKGVDTSIGAFTRTEMIDHTPDPLPPVLVVEGGSDHITAVSAQAHLPISRRFPVLGIPGTASAHKIDERAPWVAQRRLVVLFDNDDAGMGARDRIDREVTHLYVDHAYNDLSEHWAAVSMPLEEHGLHKYRQRDEAQRRWINELRDLLEEP